MPAPTDLERFERKFIPEPNSGCWIWTHALNGQGYGQVTFHKKHMDAHRLAWNLFKGIIPPGFFVCHKCNLKSCVNPFHLYLGTNSENILDAMKGGIKVGFQVINERRRQTQFCKHGHEYDAKTTRFVVVGNRVIGRACRKCAANNARKRRERCLSPVA
jgi:hypothetical protein